MPFPAAFHAIKRSLLSLPVLVFVIFLPVYLNSGLVLKDTGIYERDGNDHFFRSDTRRAFLDIAGDREANHRHTSAHPNFCIFHQPLGHIAQVQIKAANKGMKKVEAQVLASITLTATGGAASAAAFCAALLALGLSRTRALLFTGVLGMSTSHLFFASVPETYIFSALGICAVMWLALRKATAEGWWQLAALYCWSALTSNIVTIGLWSLVRHLGADWKKLVIRVTLSLTLTATLLVGLNVIQRAIYPESEYFFHPQKQKGWIYWDHLQDAPRHTRILLQHILLSNITAPEPVASVPPIEDLAAPVHKMASIEEGAWSTFAPAWPLHALWLLFIAGALASLGMKAMRTPAVLASLAVLGFNFCFFMIFGHDRMLYSALWTSTTVLLVALAWENISRRFTKAGIIITTALTLLLICQAWHNWHFLTKIVALVTSP